MASLSNWYSSQYSVWNRTRRLAVTPYVARPQHLPPIAPLVNNMNSTQQQQQQQRNQNEQAALFGPPIGVTNSASIPDWTVPRDSKDAQSPPVVPAEVVKEWIAKRKQDPQKPAATTTLQALVNLKRPSIRLTPLSNAQQPSTSEPGPSPIVQTASSAHGLEFDFDCDAPKCNIIVTAVPAPAANGTDQAQALIVLFETLVDGGFGRSLRFEDGEVLELAKLDAELHPSRSPTKSPLSQEPLASNANLSVPAIEVSGPNSPLSTPLTATSGNPPSSPANRKRMSGFHFRRKHDRQAAGPALQVVDADVEAAIQAARRASAEDHDPDDLANQGEGSSKSQEESNHEAGIRMTIRLEAFDEHDSPLASRNAQTTYLHILRMGSPPKDEGEASEDARPWVVKVVKREASLGSHTFRLQEIYGLSSSTSSAAPPISPLTPASYPPTAVNSSWDTPATECIVCLSSPREVVLLPCRHLVACRDCAVNMVEFGAGGQLSHEIEATNTTNPTANPTTDAAGEPPAAPAEIEPPLATTAATPATRRKRKAKGWFCPVCRQPYTSLLRITTHPPGKSLEGDDTSSLQSHPHSPSQDLQAPSAEGTPLAVPPPAMVANPNGVGFTNMLRALGGTRQPASNTDLESGNANPGATQAGVRTPTVVA